jgi:hypothetical protein
MQPVASPFERNIVQNVAQRATCQSEPAQTVTQEISLQAGNELPPIFVQILASIRKRARQV